ncbi:MAG TPA: hypothetical protein VN653_09910 [Anaerolineales bacterium]|nr:hypothetical protein [Anaerolineales bacterium]
MKKRIQKALPILFSLVVLVLLCNATVKIIFDRNSSGNLKLRETPDPLEVELCKTITGYKSNETSVIDLSTLTTFSWDRLYMFGAYTEPSEIDTVIGKSWRRNCYTEIRTSDGYTLLVFTKNNIVVHCSDYPKTEGYFRISEEFYKSGISSQQAIFVLDEYGMIIWVGNKTE